MCHLFWIIKYESQSVLKIAQSEIHPKIEKLRFKNVFYVKISYMEPKIENNAFLRTGVLTKLYK